MINIHHDDPQLTAYVLNELEPGERTELENAIAHSPELQQAVAEIRTTIKALQEEFISEPPLSLTTEQKQNLQKPAVKSQNSKSLLMKLYPYVLPLAACLALGMGLWSLLPSKVQHWVLAQRTAIDTPHDLTTARADDQPSFGLQIPFGDDGKLGTPLNDSGTQVSSLQTGDSANGLSSQDTLDEAIDFSINSDSFIGTARDDPFMAPLFVPRSDDEISDTRAYSATGKLGDDTLNNIQTLTRIETFNFTPFNIAEVLILPSIKSDLIEHNLVCKANYSHSEDIREILSEFDSDGDGVLDGLQGIGFHNGLVNTNSTDWWMADYLLNTEAYSSITENFFRLVMQEPLSTFSIDVDTASYANVRRFLLTQNQLPPPDAVRIEELINYFDYDYPTPPEDQPFSVNVEVAGCPWQPHHRLARIGLKGWEISNDERPAANLVFLLDVSGSMATDNKLPLVKQALTLLTHQLRRDDVVSIVVYAGASGLVLPATGGGNAPAILRALDQLQAGGSTNGGEGLQLAYNIAAENIITGGINRVILATDGDFNVGLTSEGDLVRLIEERAQDGVFLTVLGFGMGNLKDATMEKLADKGNGNYAYIDTILEAQKVLVEQLSGTLVTIAKDVKIQIEFNPAQVSAYRLIGYENRMLQNQDFNDDKKDAGEIGAGHTVTALYELVPTGEKTDVPTVDPLKYQTPATLPDAASSELLTIKLRYKQPDGDTSQLIELPVTDSGESFADASDDFAFQSAVAAFGMLLRHSSFVGDFSYDAVLEIAGSTLGEDASGYRAEFLDLVSRARDLENQLQK
ncbi:MAG: hypothetical protein HJJLKODD_02325 [Phycisphaerae bacterium]|nr:hypothetical protein [Phycisphaerae bacterium]